MSRPALISADWGTTSLRLYLLDAAGEILERRSSAKGLTAVERSQFANVLATECAAWLHDYGRLPALLSGMKTAGGLALIGAAGLAELAANTVSLDVPSFASVTIVAGVDTKDALDIPDVMRGEECQIMGALALMDLDRGTFVMPGTHSKWVTVEGRRITGFRTFMTGEVFAGLKNHTILGRMMTPSPSGEPGPAFERGVEVAASSTATGEWLHRLFSVRTLGLMGKLADADAADYLSGLLIGWELAAGAPADGRPLVVVGSRELTHRYERGAAARALRTIAAPEDCVCAGHQHIATAAGILA